MKRVSKRLKQAKTKECAEFQFAKTFQLKQKQSGYFYIISITIKYSAYKDCLYKQNSYIDTIYTTVIRKIYSIDYSGQCAL